MKIDKELYKLSINRLPQSGKHIIGHQDENSIVFYQAYKDSIADFALQNQCLGGPDYSYNRMSWIKPNFLWMMYRCGWAEKEDQNRVLALWIGKKDFEKILSEAVFSSFKSKHYENSIQWKNELHTKEVRLQWDPDHDPFGKKMERRAIQLGLKGKILENFGVHQIQRIEDITDFVKQQKTLLNANKLDEFLVPFETVFTSSEDKLNKRIGITSDN